MAEIPSYSPPSKSDTSALFADALLSADWASESDAGAKRTKLGALLPELSSSTLDAVVAALERSGSYDTFMSKLQSPEAMRQQFSAQIGDAMQRDARGDTSSIDSFLVSFSGDGVKEFGDAARSSANADSKSATLDTWSDQWAERLRDVQAFDSLLTKHPEIATRLREKGVDIDSEKQRELSKLKAENPGISNEEATVRSSLAVHLRHETAIREAAPDDGARHSLDTAFEGLRRSAREIGLPYQESIKAIRDISPFDKASILQATSASSFDTRATRTGNELRFENPGDRFSQVWTLRPGARPEKALELPNGPRIKIATALEPDAALTMKRTKATDEIANLTGWEWVRSSNGLDLARKHFPQSLTASVHEAVSAPGIWRTFLLSYADASADDRKNLVSTMRGRAATIADPNLRARMNEALNDFVSSEQGLGDNGLELLAKLGERYGRMIDQEVGDAKERIEKRGKAFGIALSAIDEVDAAESKAAHQFQQEVGWIEVIAQDNLSYFADNGYPVFGPNLWDFLSVLNKNRASVYPQAEADIELPKVLTEKDKALMAHGLVRAIGGETKVEDCFEVPGYRLKRFDLNGIPTAEQIRTGLAAGKVVSQGR